MRIRHRIVPVMIGLLALLGASPTLATTKTSKAKPTTTKPTTTRAKVTTTTKASTTTASTTTAPATVTPTTAAPTTTMVPMSGSINVFAATSLTASFTEIATAFEKAHPGVKVTLNFGGSSTLVTQIGNGAPADVFASADMSNMDKLANTKSIDGTPLIFTRNRLMIVIGKGNPLRVMTLADLARPEVFVALGAPGVPVGDYARQILSRAGVTVTPKTFESNVAAIVNKAALREIDAGIVYVTDVAIDDYRVDGIAIPDDQNVIATYPIAAVTGSRNKATSAGFVAFTRTAAAQAILAKYKFLPLK